MTSGIECGAQSEPMKLNAGRGSKKQKECVDTRDELTSSPVCSLASDLCFSHWLRAQTMLIDPRRLLCAGFGVTLVVAVATLIPLFVWRGVDDSDDRGFFWQHPLCMVTAWAVLMPIAVAAWRMPCEFLRRVWEGPERPNSPRARAGATEPRPVDAPRTHACFTRTRSAVSY